MLKGSQTVPIVELTRRDVCFEAATIRRTLQGTGIERLIPHADADLVELMKKLVRSEPQLGGAHRQLWAEGKISTGFNRIE